jgi:fatty acid desaturase
MTYQWLRAALGLSMFVVPALLVLGIVLEAPALAFATVMFVFPMMRRIVGKIEPDDSPIWNERIATLLDRLPLIYAPVLAGCIALVLLQLAFDASPSAAKAVGLGLSLWMVMLFATCVAHELTHRRDPRQAMVGQCIAGMAGYPLLCNEHLRHHARAGDTSSAEWPRVEESVWRFAARRAWRIFSEAYGSRSSFWRLRARGRHVWGLRVATLTALATASLFAVAGGWRGLVIYLGAATAVTFGMQLFTYIQHWGLGDDRLGERSARGFGWEDDCRLQAWMTLGISLHHSHHQSTYRPYYCATLAGDSPRLPAGYVVLMVVCLFPRLWRAAMQPALEHWERSPNDPRSPGRNLTCFNLYSETGSAPPVSP